MAALAYLLPPLSGLAAYLNGRSARTRAHGLHAVAFGAAWPSLLYLGSVVTPGVTQAVFVAGVVAWAGLVAATAAGRDPLLPGLDRFLWRAAAHGLHGPDVTDEA